MNTKGDFITISSNSGELEGVPLKNSIDLVFPTVGRDYLNEYRLFAHLFGAIPNKIAETKIDIEKARKWFLGNYGHFITNSFFNEKCFGKNETAKLDDCIYTLAPDLLVYFDTQQHIMRYLFRKTDYAFVQKLVSEINVFKEVKSDEAEIYLLVMRGSNFDLEKFHLKLPDLAIEDNYNNDLLPMHTRIVERLNKKQGKGLVLLHGEPGTGKTSYIRYLSAILKKKIIFFPPNLAEQITHPNLITLLIENPDSILVIEDAENILLDRNYVDKSGVSALLNLSDGLLADCLNIQIICTFNTDLAKIDSALLRRGRLIASYKFERLTCEKALNLSDKLGFNNYISEELRLTDIYNQEEMIEETKPKMRVGFKTY